MTDQTVVVRVKKSVAEQIEALEAKIVSLRAKLNADALLNNVAQGNDIGFTFGRGEKARELRGVVTAVREPSETEGKLYRVVINQGTFEEQAFKVRPDQVTANFSAASDEAPVADASDDEGPLSED